MGQWVNSIGQVYVPKRFRTLGEMRRLINFWGGAWAVTGLVVGSLLSLLVAYLVGVDTSDPARAVGPGAVIGLSLGYYFGERRKEQRAS